MNNSKREKSALAIDSENEVDANQISVYGRKRQLLINLKKLPDDKYQRVMQIIELGEPSYSNGNLGNVTIDEHLIKILKPSTLRKLESYVASCLKRKIHEPAEIKPKVGKMLNDVDGQLSIKKDAETDANPMSMDELGQLIDNIKQLPDHIKDEALQIIRSLEAPYYSRVIRIDIQMLKPSTLRKLESYITSCIEKAERRKQKRKRKRNKVSGIAEDELIVNEHEIDKILEDVSGQLSTIKGNKVSGIAEDELIVNEHEIDEILEDVSGQLSTIKGNKVSGIAEDELIVNEHEIDKILDDVSGQRSAIKDKKVSGLSVDKLNEKEHDIDKILEDVSGQLSTIKVNNLENKTEEKQMMIANEKNQNEDDFIIPEKSDPDLLMNEYQNTMEMLKITDHKKKRNKKNLPIVQDLSILPPVNGSEKNLCVVCIVSEKTHALIPCGHMPVCGDCLLLLNPKCCPLCNEPFSSYLRVWL